MLGRAAARRLISVKRADAFHARSGNEDRGPLDRARAKIGERPVRVGQRVFLGVDC